MNLDTLEFVPELRLPTGATLYRVQLSRARRDSQRIGPLRLAPPSLMSGRFDLPATPVAYLAESPDTALYEAVFRREVLAVSFTRLAQRSLLSLQTHAPLTLADLRGHASAWPVLQSLRFSATQTLAADLQRRGFDGIVYRSARHSPTCAAGGHSRWWAKAAVCTACARKCCVDRKFRSCPDIAGMRRSIRTLALTPC